MTELRSDEISKYAELSGNVRGAALQTDASYILRHYGAPQLAYLESSLQQIGQAIQYQTIRAMEWFPLGKRVISFLLLQRNFDWSDNEFRRMGNEAPKFSFIVKLLMKFFTSAKTAFNHAPEYWTRHYDVGSLEAQIIDEEKQYAVVILRDFTVHPLYCRYLEGYFLRLFQIMFPKHNVRITETECPFAGDANHVFKAEWGKQ